MLYGIKYLQQFIAGSSTNVNDQVIRSNTDNIISDDSLSNSESEVKANDPEDIDNETALEPKYASG